MNNISFYKYQGTGNDFILIDNRQGTLVLAEETISKMCNRKFGIGSDGLMLIQPTSSPLADFYLEFYNPDGSKSFCGNGSRCAVAFARFLGVCTDKTEFLAIDGMHSATIDPDGKVALRMKDVEGITTFRDGFFLNTGSPHVVLEVNDLDSFPVYEQGKLIRYDDEFKPGGTNVNFAHRISENHFAVRTYERGVEDETLSCGTGVVAVALAMHKKYNLKIGEVTITTKGGDLTVNMESYHLGYKNVVLNGPTCFVYSGNIEVN